MKFISVDTPRFLNMFGIDRPIAYAILGRGWTIVAGPVSMYMIARFLTIQEQGYYFTFSSILGLQVFFELGLSGVIMQFASHEMASLNWAADGTLTGDPVAKSRLSSLFRSSLKWYSVVAALIVLIVLPVGVHFFKVAGHSTEVSWQLPWFWVVTVTAFGCLISPSLAVLQGCGLVPEVLFLQLSQQVAGNLFLWLALGCHWALFATPVTYTVALLLALYWLGTTKRHMLKDLYSFRHASIGLSWRNEVWPMQWKIALSWLSGYFIFQLFTPILFAYQGAEAAGQMGMSMAVTQAALGLGMTWVTTKAPLFGKLIAMKEYKALDKIFFRTLMQSLSLIFCGACFLLLAVEMLNHFGHPFASRLLSPTGFAFLVAAAIINHVVLSEAIYLRAHKSEPFLWISILNGIYMAVSGYFLGRYSGATAMAAGYLMGNLVIGLGAGTWIFQRRRRQWHGH